MKILLRSILLLSIPTLLFAGDTFVKAINIEGNKRTKESIIRRELRTEVGGLFDEALLHDDKNQLYNMGIFSEVNVLHEMIGDSVEVTIILKERFFILPFPLVKYHEDFGWSYGGGALINNLAGRNQKAGIVMELGGTTQYLFVFKDPWLMGDRLSIDVEIARLDFDHPYEDFHVIERFASAEIGRRWNNYHWWYIKGGYRRIDLDSTGVTLTGADYDLMPYTLLTYLYDSSDIWANPSRGCRLSAKIGQYGYPTKFPDFRRLEISAAKFFKMPVGRTLGLNIVFCEKHGSLPIYENYYVGSSSTIRGLEKNLDSGSHIFGGSVEYRFDIYKTRPIIPKLDFGMGMALFYDNGTVWNRGEDISSSQFYSGYGIGLRFFVPVIDVGRLDFGWTDDGSYRLHATAGAKF